MERKYLEDLLNKKKREILYNIQGGTQPIPPPRPSEPQLSWSTNLTAPAKTDKVKQ